MSVLSKSNDDKVYYMLHSQPRVQHIILLYTTHYDIIIQLLFAMQVSYRLYMYKLSTTRRIRISYFNYNSTAKIKIDFF